MEANVGSQNISDETHSSRKEMLKKKTNTKWLDILVVHIEANLGQADGPKSYF